MAEHYFKVSIELSPGTVRERRIGPFDDEDLDEFGNPPSEDVEIAVWQMIEDVINVREVS